jgi:hypothetical protein
VSKFLDYIRRTTNIDVSSDSPKKKWLLNHMYGNWTRFPLLRFITRLD